MPNVRIIAKGQRGEQLTKLKVNFAPSQSSTPSLMPETESVYLRRATEGTGELMELVGGTVAWNQICPLWSVGATATVNGVTRTVNADGSYTFTNTATANANLNYDSSAFKFTANHVYYLHGASGGSSNTYQNVVTGYNAYTRDDALFKPATDKTEHFRLVVTNGVTVNLTFSPYVTDLTQMLGPTIADYVYSLEQQSAGSGIAWLKKYDLIDGAYHAYSAPTLQSVEATAHVTRGKNNYPLPIALTKSGVTVEPTADGKVRIHGTPEISSGYIKFDNVPIVSDWVVGKTVTLSVSKKVAGIGFTAGSSNGSLNLTMSDTVTSKTGTYTSGNRLPEINVRYDVGAIDETIAVQLEVGNTATAFSPYMEITTALDSDLVLRGIQKLDNGVLSYDGDTYEWDGTVTRKWAEIDLGTLNWYANGQSGDEYEYAYNLTGKANGLTNMVCSGMIVGDSAALGVIRGRTASSIISTRSTITTKEAFKTAMNGVKLVYELATPTTESADPFTAVQTVEDGGTEEFVTTNNVPVGVIGRFANAVPMEGVDSFSVTADDGTVHTYPVTLSEEIYRGYVDMLTGEAVSEAASIAEYNGETIATPWLSSLDVYSSGATPTKGAQVVYPITPEEVTAVITGDPTELGNVVSVSSTEGTVDWSEMAPLDGKCIVRVVS